MTKCTLPRKSSTLRVQPATNSEWTDIGRDMIQDIKKVPVSAAQQSGFCLQPGSHAEEPQVSTPRLLPYSASNESEILVVDHQLTVSQMVGMGSFCEVDDAIAHQKNPVRTRGLAAYQIRLFWFEHHISSDEAFLQITSKEPANPWLPATIQHLICFSVQSPDEQLRNPTVALGGLRKNRKTPVVPCLENCEAGRTLLLYHWSGDWCPGCQFLAVRRLSQGDWREARQKEPVGE
jgi:hypothetical protein